MRRFCDLTDIDPAEIELVDPGIELVAVGIVDLAQPSAALDGLADFDVEAGQLAGNRRPHVQVVEILACKG